MKQPRSLAILPALLLLVSCRPVGIPEESPSTPPQSDATTSKYVIAKLDASLPPLSNEPVRKAAPSVGRPAPRPHFETTQSDEELIRVLEQPGPHALTVLFRDDLKVRVKHGQGKIRGRRDNRGLVAYNDGGGTLDALSQLLAGSDIDSIQALGQADQLSEAQLASEESRAEQRFGGDFPNRGSFANLCLSSGAPGVRKLIASLRHSGAVRGLSVSETPSISAVSYRQPPNDSYFPPRDNWQPFDYLNTSPGDDILGDPARVWYWNRHSFGGAWETTKGNWIKVGIIDNGFELNVTDGLPFDYTLKRSFYQDWWHTYNDTDVDWTTGTLSKEKDPFIEHGTQTSHCLAGRDNNAFGVCGGAPQVTLIPIRATKPYYGGWITVIDSLDYAIGTGAKVVNISIGDIDSAEADLGMRWALSRAWDSGVTVVLSAGNSSRYCGFDSGVYTGAIAVGAIKIDSGYSGISNWGPRVDLAAGGEEITVNSHGSDPNNRIVTVKSRISGTSFSAPLVAAAAALVRTYTSDVAAVRDLLVHTCDWMFGGDRRMDHNDGGFAPDGINKLRVLNADAAVKVAAAYDPSNPYTVYMSASDDYAYVRLMNGSREAGAWFPGNITFNYWSGATVQTWTYNSGGPWASSTAIFKHRRLYSAENRGVCYELKADGAMLHGTASNDDQTVGWKNGWQWTLP